MAAAAGSSSSTPLPCGNHVLKLCINSHVAYHLPLRTLIRSLLNTTFDHYSDVLLLLGGNTDESPPISVKLSDVIPNLGGTDHEVVLVRTRSNAFDYHGLSLLYRYRTHPLVKAGLTFTCTTQQPLLTPLSSASNPSA